MAGRDNLVPLTTEKAREIGKKGGKASGKAKQERKRLSEFYAEALAREYEIETAPAVYKDGKLVREAKKERLSGQRLVDYVFGQMFGRCDMVTAKLLENIGDFTEGKKQTISGDPEKPLTIIQVVGVKSNNED
jgi:hypothetical protein